MRARHRIDNYSTNTLNWETAMAAELPLLRRIVTEVNAAGRSVIVDDGPPPAVRRSNGRPGFNSRNIWATFSTPALIDDPDRSKDVLGLMPPAAGTVIKYIDFPPEPKDPAERAKLARESIERQAALAPERGLRRRPQGAPHHGMHETDTMDYAIVLSGEIYAIMDEGETLMKAGDVMIQRGTNHAWDNRSDAPCRMIFVLIDGKWSSK
jgi:hypothetical protein